MFNILCNFLKYDKSERYQNHKEVLVMTVIKFTNRRLLNQIFWYKNLINFIIILNKRIN